MRNIFIFILIIALLLTSCNSNKTNYVSEDYRRVTNVYKTDIVSLPDGYKLSYHGSEEITRNFVLVDNDRVHVLCCKDEDYIIYSVDMNNENENIIHINFNKSQLFYSIGIFDESTYLARIGNVIYKVFGDGNPYHYFAMDESFDDEYPRADEQIIVYDNHVYMFINNKIYIYSLEGEYISTIPQPDYLYNSYNCNGQIYFPETRSPPGLTYTLEENELKSFKAIPAPANVIESSLNDGKHFSVLYGSGYDIYYRNLKGIYGYNEGEEEAEFLLSWANSDIFEHGIGIASTEILSIISPEKFVVALADSLIRYKYQLCIMTHISDDEVTPKVHIELAMTSDDEIVRRAVTNFNRNNEKYRIVIRDYFTNSTVDRWGYEVLNLDIGTGDIPDIIITSQSPNTDNYISKGLFVDLYDYIPSAKNIMDGVRYVNETNGKLYKLPICFGVSTLAGKKETVGEKPSMTFDELLELNENLPEDATLVLYYWVPGYSFGYMYSLIKSMIGEFVDFENSTCNFKTDYFIKVLKYLHSLQPRNWDNYYVESGIGSGIVVPRDYLNLFGENKIYMQMMQISSPLDLAYLHHAFGENYVIKGYPTKEGNGSRINSLLSFGITEKSKVKEGAVQFIEYLLSDEIQSNMVSIISEFPVIRENLEKTFENGPKYFFVSKEFGHINMNRKEIGFIRDLSSYSEPFLNRITAYELDENYYQKFLECLDNTTVINRNIDVIYNIIYEELDVYFNDVITPEQCAGYIQNRVSLYLNEQK